MSKISDHTQVNFKKVVFQLLEGHVLCKEARHESENTKPFKPKRVLKGKQNEEEEKVTSASALLSSVERETKCGFCTLKHETASCKLAATKTPEERWDMLKKNSTIPVCYNCLQPGNVSRNSRTCKKPKCSVDGCGKRHLKPFHTDVIKKEKADENMETMSRFVSSKTGQKNLLPTACARLIYNRVCGSFLLGSKSEETFLRTSVCDNLGMKKSSPSATMKINMLGGETQQKKVHRVAFKIAPMNSMDEQCSVNMKAWTVNNVCVPPWRRWS